MTNERFFPSFIRSSSIRLVSVSYPFRIGIFIHQNLLHRLLPAFIGHFNIKKYHDKVSNKFPEKVIT